MCSTTGLKIGSGAVSGYRIAKSSYGPVKPRLRPDVPFKKRKGWSRFDVPGYTIYLGDTQRTAYLETLSPIQVAKNFRTAVKFAAKRFGFSYEETAQRIEEDWVRNGNMVPGWLPASWRDGRLMYELEVYDDAMWVDLTSAESLAAIRRHLHDQLAAIGQPDITMADLMGENRVLTTLIAEWVYKQTLDNGHKPAGIKFLTKYGGGTCWAYWLRRKEVELSDDPVAQLSGEEIRLEDPAFKAALEMYGIKTR